ncbi:MAG: heavy metal-associated domain-containing protein [Bacteroidota bacterium]|nr:heavy metal-associated domain-containing protein [Bacteroidota bacterium]|tara:strand:+ start:910 stop:1458 length:549 start_codon:yes stop_codon:yes gene_type:complete
MKKQFILILFFLFSSFFSFSQSFNSVITVNGLTCAMCSFSTQKSLEKLDFIKEITADLESTSFKLVFDDSKFIDFNMIQEKVEDAGFFVGTIKVNFDKNLSPDNNEHTVYNKNLFHFIIANTESSSTYNLIDKNFISDNDFESFSQFTSHTCYLTGAHNESCCLNHENLKSKKVFHLEPDSE